ncbi:MAG: hypothetical protein A3F74_03150 [Betaproteobacteria bacterium RIFCSPLOWO2_12_FULL_62_58]|nr:MAG: hypothetical protein A3F74_03150 [Betaproteobacteria bacterium RIFCSPLOWO2_12_FULL_62_58]
MKIVPRFDITDAVLVSSNVAESDYTLWSGATTYPLAARVRLVAAEQHEVYQSLQADNIDHAPATSPTWWVKVGATNRWRMFDQRVTDQTENADSIDCTFAVAGRINAVTLHNIDAAELRVTLTDAVDGVVYDRTVNLIADSGVPSWYSWFFAPIDRVHDVALTDVPPYRNATLTVTLTDTGGTVKCGECMFGLGRDLGNTDWGFGVGVREYGRKEADAFGNYDLVPRANSRRGEFVVWVDARNFNAALRQLSELSAVAAAYIGTDIHAATIIFGFYRDFRFLGRHLNWMILNLDIEGLT